MGTKQACRVVEAELRAALPAPLCEGLPEHRVAPEAQHAPRDLLRIVRVEDQSGVADEVRQELATGSSAEKASQTGSPQPSNRLGKTSAVASS